MSKRGPDPEVPDERLLFEIMLTRGPAVFASEIEDHLPISRQTINRRLDGLEEDGLVVSKKAAGRRVWWVTDSGKEAAADMIRGQLAQAGDS